MSQPSSDLLLWVDIETTGLDCRQTVPDQILEFGFKLTDKYGDPIPGRDPWSTLVYNDGWKAALAASPPAFEMHMRSGLVRELDAQHPHIPAPDEVEKTVLMILEEWDIQPLQLPMAGNSVHFDRDFLRVWMPTLEAFFHYRNFDVRTMTTACKLLNPRVAAHAPKKQEAHRSLPDIDDSIGTYKFLIDEFFIVDDSEA